MHAHCQFLLLAAHIQTGWNLQLNPLAKRIPVVYKIMVFSPRHTHFVKWADPGLNREESTVSLRGMTM